jgi:hypothetical protein
MQTDATQEDQDRPAHETLSELRPNVRLEEEVGTRLGSSKLLFRPLQRHEAEELNRGHSLPPGR